MDRGRERFGGSTPLLHSLENADLTRLRPKSKSKDHAEEYSWHQPDECLRARRGKAENRREELLHLLYRENISPGQAEELVKEWIALVVERDLLLKEQLDKERRCAKVEYVRALRQVLQERPTLGDCSEEVTLREALLSLERHVVDYCRNTNISATPHKSRTNFGRYTNGRGRRRWADRFNNSYDASHSFSDSSTPINYSEESDSISRFETASLTVPERMVFSPNFELTKPAFTPPPPPPTSQSTAHNYFSSAPTTALTQPTSPRPTDEIDAPLMKAESTVNKDILLPSLADLEPPATRPSTSPPPPPPPPPPFLPPPSYSSSKKTAVSRPSPLATSSKKKRGVKNVAMGTGQFASTAPQTNLAGKKLFGNQSKLAATTVVAASTQPQCSEPKDPSLLDSADDRKSLLDEISSVGQQHLRRTNKARSPGGTPIKYSKNRLTLTNNSDMFQRALISKFRSMQHSSTPIKGGGGAVPQQTTTLLQTTANENSGSFDISSAWSDINNSVAYEDPDITATSSSGLVSGLSQQRDPNNLSSAV